MKSVMLKDFSRIPQANINRSTFNRSHGLKTAFDGGYLVPIECQEVLPGDEVKMNARMLVRMAPSVTCPMDNVWLDTQWFFVPDRLIWTNFTKMMGERVNPKDSIDYAVPVINSGENGFAVGSLADYLGVPTGVANLDVSCLPFRAYAKIWDDWYRSETLQDSIIQSSDDLDDTGGTIEWNTLLKRGKRFDYFTQALPTPQRGDGVNLPIGTYAPVVGNGLSLGLTDGTNNLGLINGNSNGYVLGLESAFDKDVGTVSSGVPSTASKAVGVTTTSSKSGLIADLSEATAATINSMRIAFQTQRYLERLNVTGDRYVEILRGMFNVVSPDARLQRSEYLGGSSDVIRFNPVLQTSATDANGTAQGNLTANPKGSGFCSFHRAFTEHGWLIGLASVRCDLNYQQGLPRHFTRRTRFDFFWPQFQHLGEQEIRNVELFAQGKSVTNEQGQIVDDLPFGYVPRYDEYRYAPSMITGKMRSSASGSLDVWHFAQDFETLPVLNSSFIEESPPLDRVLAITDEPEILMDAYFEQYWTRPICTYGTPGLIDHF